MRCPYCHFIGSRVLDSRPAHEGKSIRRRRQCESCGRRFTTFEILEKKPLIVIKKDGGREEFNRDKLLRGLIRACEKRSVPMERLEELVDDVERSLRESNETEVPTREIGEYIMERLVDVDEVAYVRFASVYRQFRDITVFVKELEELLNRSRNERDREKRKSTEE
ncbi:transcriptional regulator NrdR [Kroppenstedtia sanguinis]|uniref:Transcriptional repressor NrdR n=1 Tax=Kroppenstedtia sanguinis TaxID=1380684 RepID=A0ABW4C5R4_9BACL